MSEFKMIDPKLLAFALCHPLTGKFFHKATFSYHYLLAGRKMAEHSYLPSNDLSWPEIDRMIWREILNK